MNSFLNYVVNLVSSCMPTYYYINNMKTYNDNDNEVLSDVENNNLSSNTITLSNTPINTPEESISEVNNIEKLNSFTEKIEYKLLEHMKDNII